MKVAFASTVSEFQSFQVSASFAPNIVFFCGSFQVFQVSSESIYNLRKSRRLEMEISAFQVLRSFLSPDLLRIHVIEDEKLINCIFYSILSLWKN